MFVFQHNKWKYDGEPAPVWGWTSQSGCSAVIITDVVVSVHTSTPGSRLQPCEDCEAVAAARSWCSSQGQGVRFWWDFLVLSQTFLSLRFISQVTSLEFTPAAWVQGGSLFSLTVILCRCSCTEDTQTQRGGAGSSPKVLEGIYVAGVKTPYNMEINLWTTFNQYPVGFPQRTSTNVSNVMLVKES